MGAKKNPRYPKEGGADFVASPVQGGPDAIAQHNKTFYEKATPAQRQIIDQVQAEIDQINTGMEHQYFLERVGRAAGIDLTEVQKRILDAKPGEFLEFGPIAVRDSVGNPKHYGTYVLVKTYSNEIQELKSYTRRLEHIVAKQVSSAYMESQLALAGTNLQKLAEERAELQTSVSKALEKVEQYATMSFWQRLKFLFNPKV